MVAEINSQYSTTRDFHLSDRRPLSLGMMMVGFHLYVSDRYTASWHLLFIPLRCVKKRGKKKGTRKLSMTPLHWMILLSADNSKCHKFLASNPPVERYLNKTSITILRSDQSSQMPLLH